MNRGVFLLWSLFLSSKFHTFAEGLLIEWNQMMMTLGKGLFETAEHSIDFNNRTLLQESAEQNHIVSLGILKLNGRCHRID